MSITWNELHDAISNIRREIEIDIPCLLDLAIAPPGDSSNVVSSSSSSAPQNGHRIPSAHTEAHDAIMSQTWDVVESPMFRAVMVESLDLCFQLVMQNLKSCVFTVENPANHAPLKTPALASVLPQIKAVAARLLPTEGASVHIRDVVSGPYMDALCTAVFDSEGADFYENDEQTVASTMH